MNHRTEPTKEQNEADIRALKRETRQAEPHGLAHAVAGLGINGDAYEVIAYSAQYEQAVLVGRFYFGKLTRELARNFAEEQADKINETK